MKKNAMLTQLAVAVLPVACLAQTGIDHIQWRQDVVLPNSVAGYSETLEDLSKIKSTALPGTLQIFFRNTGKEAISLDSFTVDGKSFSELRKERRVTWFKTIPAQVLPGEFGCFMLRFRDTPERVDAVLNWSDKTTSELNAVTPGKQKQTFRIESVGFAPQQMNVYFKKLAPNVKLKEFSVNGAKQNELFFSEKFDSGLNGISIPEKFAPGTRVYLKATAEDGSQAAYLMPVSDNHYPLGTYDWPKTLDTVKLARAGMNHVAAHHSFPQEQLDDMGNAGLRCTQYTNKKNPVDELRLLHPAIDTLLVFDEPDVHDYMFFKDKEDAPPMALRVGEQAPEIVDGSALILQNSNKRSGVLVNLTIRPYNWFEYGETCDMLYQDNYALTHGDPIESLRYVQRNAMSAAAPLPVVHIFDNCFQEEKGRGIERPKTAAEQRRIMLYAAGAGAKGMIGWWNVSAPSGPNRIYHAISKYPDQWTAQSNVFHSLGRISDLLIAAHPWDGKVAGSPDLTVQTLISGRDAMIITVINDLFKYTKTRHELTVRENALISMEIPEWLNITELTRVSERGFTPIPYEVHDGTLRFTLKKLEVGEILLASGKPNFSDNLERDYRQKQDALAIRLLSAQRAMEERSGTNAAILTDLQMNRNEALVASDSPGYQVKNTAWFLKPDQKVNSYNFYSKDVANDTVGVHWRLSGKSGQKAVAAIQYSSWGKEPELALADLTGKPLSLKTTVLSEDANTRLLEFTLPESGECELKVMQMRTLPECGMYAGKNIVYLPGFEVRDLLVNKK